MAPHYRFEKHDRFGCWVLYLQDDQLVSFDQRAELLSFCAGIGMTPQWQPSGTGPVNAKITGTPKRTES